MLESTSPRLPPKWQLAICLVMIVVIRIYYAWVESSPWLLRWFDGGLGRIMALLLVSGGVSYLAARLARRYFNPIMAVPFAAAAGGATTLVYTSIPGTVLGACVGLVVCNDTLGTFLGRIGRIFLVFGPPSLLTGFALGMLASSLLLRNTPWSWVVVIAVLPPFLAGMMVLAFRRHPKSLADRGFAMVYVCVALGLGMFTGPSANTLLRARALERVGYVSWDNDPAYGFTALGYHDVTGVILQRDATDRELAIVAAYPHVRWLNLEGANVSSQACQELFRQLPQLEVLEVQDVALEDPAIRSLARSRSLFLIRLRRTSISDQSFVHLATIATLRHLHVEGVSRRGNGLRALGLSGRVHQLQIENMALHDDDLRDLNGLQGLSSLSLRKTRITGSGLRHLTQHPRLTSLTIAESPLQPRFIAALKPMKLNWLKVHDIPMTAEGLRAIAGMRQLVGLSLLGTGISDDQLRLLDQVSVSRIHLDGGQLTSDATDRLQRIEDVVIFVHNRGLTSADIERLAKMDQEICITNCTFDDTAIQSLVELDDETSRNFEIRCQDLSTQTRRLLADKAVRVRTAW